MAKQVAQEVQPAQAAQCSSPRVAKPTAALEHPLDRCRQPQVGVRDHKQSSSQATLLDAIDELPPEVLRLAVNQGDAKHLTLAEGEVSLGLPRSGCRSLPPRPLKPPAISAPGGRGGRCHQRRRTGSEHGPAQRDLNEGAWPMADAAFLRLGEALATPRPSTRTSP